MDGLSLLCDKLGDLSADFCFFLLSVNEYIVPCVIDLKVRWFFSLILQYLYVYTCFTRKCLIEIGLNLCVPSEKVCLRFPWWKNKINWAKVWKTSLTKGGRHFGLSYKTVQVCSKETYYGEPLMGCIFHSQADKHPSCAVLGLSGYEQNQRDPQGPGWVWTKLDLSQTILRFQPLSNWLNWSWLSTNTLTIQAIILFIINQNNNVEWRNSLSMCPEVSLFYIVLFSNSDMNIEMQLCGQQAKGLWEQKTSVFAVWKYWSVSQATSLFWSFRRYCVDYYWSWWKWRFPGIKHWCFTDAALLHISFASDVAAHCHNRRKHCGMKDISIDANLIEQW